MEDIIKSNFIDNKFQCIYENGFKYCVGNIIYNNVIDMQRCNKCDRIFDKNDVIDYINKNKYLFLK